MNMEVVMNMIDRKEKELKKLWKTSQLARSEYKEQLLHRFWQEYRILRKTKKFISEVKMDQLQNVESEAS